MKYRIFILGLIAILFAACAVSEVDHSAPLLDDGEEFYATIEDATTKAYVDEDLRVLWHADDRVSIFYEYTFNRQYRFTGETGANAGTFEKVPQEDFITGNALEYVYAVYPYKEDTKISNRGVLTVTLPETQAYAEDSFGIGANTMVSCSEGNELLFKNLCGYIMLKLYGEDVAVSSISLKGNNDEPLAGKATVTASIGADPSLTFDETATDEIMLTFDSPVTLGTTAETATVFWLVVPPTTFESGITLTVKDNRNGVFEKATTQSLQISRNTLSRMSVLEVMPEAITPEAVDLGLPSGLKWASFNLGASRPEEYGDYYAWGEIEPYYSSLDPLTWKEGKEAGYAWASYKWCMGSDGTYTKYCTDSSCGYNGFTDGKTVLDQEDDAAHLALGGKWRMPTDAEFTELRENCTWEWTMLNGVDGQKVTSNMAGYTDKWIFLPAAGYRYYPVLNSVGSIGSYWSSSLDADSPHAAWSVDIRSSGVLRRSLLRFYGFPVRPVYEASVWMSGSAVSAPVEMTKVEAADGQVLFDEVYTFRGALAAGTLDVMDGSTAVLSGIAIPAAGNYHVMYNKTSGRCKVYTQEMYVDFIRGSGEHGASVAPWKMLRNTDPDTVDDTAPNYTLVDYDGELTGARCDVSAFTASVSDYKYNGTNGNDKNIPTYFADDEEWTKGVLYDGLQILKAGNAGDSDELAVVITGLDAAAKYDFRLVSARFNASAAARQTRFTLVGAATSEPKTVNQGWKPANVAAMSTYDFMSVHKVDFDGIAPDSAGTVTIKMQGVDTGTRADAHFNGLRIAKQL